MTTSKLVTTCNVEALDPTEAKAAFLSLYKQQRPWIEITDDPATWPLHAGVVLAKTVNGDVAFMVCHFGNAGIGLFWATPKNMHWTEDGKIGYEDFSLVNVPFQDATHWRPI